MVFMILFVPFVLAKRNPLIICFLSSTIVANIWTNILDWANLELLPSQVDPLSHFEAFESLLQGKINKKVTDNYLVSGSLDHMIC